MQSVFDSNAAEYDSWFDKNNYAYQSELEAVRRFIPRPGLGIEIGSGTGRFSTPFNISIGVEPSRAMAKIGDERGITIHNAFAEDLPFCKNHFDFVLMINTICFVEYPIKALSEAYRILIDNGQLIIGILDRETALGRIYDSIKSSHKFYKKAKFYSTEEIMIMLQNNGFREIQTCQTIFLNPESMNEADEVKEGFGEGLFVVINSIK
ncbi:MAG: class I SAM-dependent methyltransferase [Bacteroidetes bacterium]|nr:class I SAM-dependent methyltransferase [Bacteroidota bacterium]MBU2585128.1 class I SAM-dependent methyltransferase [Bacteroidota bacterium]